MKKIISTLLICIAIIGFAFAQSPNIFKYQAIVRDNSGNIIATQTVKFRISLLRSSPGGTTSYTEQQTTATNQFGLANLEIGNGSNQIGSMDTIKWAMSEYFIKIELDPTGGSAFQLMGISQLMSVPYALSAKTSEKALNDNDTSSTNELQNLSLVGNTLSISNGNSVNIGAQIPYGSIMPYAGAISPTGWLLCDGSAVSRTTYANLFSTIGTAYGSGDGSTTFNLPDFRGRFMRGVDGTAGNDQDKMTRTASNIGGNVGNNVGSLQGDTLQSHNHNLMIRNNYGDPNPTTYSYLGSGDIGGGGIWTNSIGIIANNVSIASNGGNETRPVNIYVNFIIKY